jgi:hypothetical protein
MGFATTLPILRLLIVISQEFYRLLQDHQMHGYWVEPAHLE